jgi:hypothetical protein
VSADMVCCPFCLSLDPNKVGIENATGIVCRHAFHCPSPEFHGNPFRMCPHCSWNEETPDWDGRRSVVDGDPK